MNLDDLVHKINNQYKFEIITEFNNNYQNDVAYLCKLL